MSTQIFFTPSQAGKLVAVSERSIRRAIKDKEIAVTVHHGRYQISFSDLLTWSEAMPNRRRKRDQSGIGQFVRQWKILT